MIWMNEISKELVCRIGEHSERDSSFPEKVNTQLLNVLDRTNIQIEIYERGAGYAWLPAAAPAWQPALPTAWGLADWNMHHHMPGCKTLEVEVKEDGNRLHDRRGGIYRQDDSGKRDGGTPETEQRDESFKIN